MARPSKLSDNQWNEVLRLHLDGESIRSIARKFDVAESAIRARISAQSKTIKSLAHQVVETEKEIKALPINAQCAVMDMASVLRSISTHLGQAANYGAMTAHRLQALAHSEVQKVDDADPLQSIEALKGVSALTRLANESADIGINLMRANKEAVDRMNEPASDDNELLRKIAERLPD